MPVGGLRGGRSGNAAPFCFRRRPRPSALLRGCHHSAASAQRCGAVRAAGAPGTARPRRGLTEPGKAGGAGPRETKVGRGGAELCVPTREGCLPALARLPSCLLSCLRCSPSPQRLKLFHFLHLSARCPVLPKELILRGEGTASVLAVYGRRELKLCWEQDLTLISPLGAHSLLLSLVLSSTRS